jgi:hypothetical protein
VGHPTDAITPGDYTQRPERRIASEIIFGFGCSLAQYAAKRVTVLILGGSFWSGRGAAALPAGRQALERLTRPLAAR